MSLSKEYTQMAEAEPVEAHETHSPNCAKCGSNEDVRSVYCADEPTDTEHDHELCKKCIAKAEWHKDSACPVDGCKTTIKLFRCLEEFKDGRRCQHRVEVIDASGLEGSYCPSHVRKHERQDERELKKIEVELEGDPAAQAKMDVRDASEELLKETRRQIRLIKDDAVHKAFTAAASGIRALKRPQPEGGLGDQLASKVAKLSVNPAPKPPAP
jgi:hypothetical protein